MNRRGKNNASKNLILNCRCLAHDNWSGKSDRDQVNYKLLKVDSKKFKSSVIAYLRDNQLLGRKANWLCSSCYDEAYKRCLTDSQDSNNDASKPPMPKEIKTDESNRNSDHVKETLSALIECLENFSYDVLIDGLEELWQKALLLIGSKLCKTDIYNDGLTVQAKYKDTSYLVESDILAFIKERNILLVKFLCGISGLLYENESNEIKYAFATAVEYCYYLRNFRLVLPYSFMANLVQSCISGSKSVSVVNGKTSPGGSYTTYKNWLSMKGSEKLECVDGTIDIFFDNIGKYIVKNYRVSVDKTKTADIVTTGIQILLNEEKEKDIQKRSEFKPKRCTQENLKTTHTKMKEEISKYEEMFRVYRYQFLSHLFAISSEEIDREIEHMKCEISKATRRICSNDECRREYDTLKKKCSSCGGVVIKDSSPIGSVRNFQISQGAFDDLPLGINEGREYRPKVKMIEPILLNPNSYKNVEQIITELQEFAGVGIYREWVFLGCDGPPYCLAERIIEKNPEKFEGISMVPGLGHLHMNQLKTLFKIMDKIILEPLAKEVLNFQSPNAYQFFVEAKDTHKSWQALQILLFGTGLEIINMYRGENRGSETESNVLEFLKWQSNHKNATIQLIAQLIFTYALAIYLFKIGVRNNDVDLINASRYKFDVLFYSFKHPYYREVEYRDLRNRVLYPQSVLAVRNANMSFSENVVDKKSQGGDFILEGKVKRQKLIAPKGPIKADTWKVLSRSLDDFQSIYDSTSTKLNLQDPNPNKNIDLSREIVTWCAVLRSHEYLQTVNFSGKPKNINGEFLANDLVDFTNKAELKRSQFFELIESGANIVGIDYKCLQVLPGFNIDDLLYQMDIDT